MCIEKDIDVWLSYWVCHRNWQYTFYLLFFFCKP